ncbi:Hydroxymethylglutaryl-CoA lyase, mitochondrial, putative [Trypanosoma equiperdum]|uniref:hydroxymethylglutaryl-CoA lyase n=3 Tax=Trypanozoon TaxID=39700 RepID=D6XFK6_TRYB2|nr:hydroxymethylglutaryl-CoA lyase, putative [Trypanosoma brucei brucei TREU927]AAX79027.1 hydroxymethylglutaryl-CoA lyase, putative [Trypanosoma brucei]AAX80809.1 3-hydroxy-3-methylglutaryl-CoA lyase, putative [Trypanosoma brucei]AAZ10861.1 hydroxymethylglutaryl-CoA lyase, putative [Trypanosoma brucei brucei TREU927]SCU65362.1 Hydroxymethylglutaryl-CoA lyase, mitochondrial, putative [Trypanosoma equiperdum]
MFRTLPLRSSIRMVECPRDAMQGLPHFIPTEQKIRYLKALLKCGFYALDCGSFVSPRAVPQMRDSTEVIANCWKTMQEEKAAPKLSVVVASLAGFKQALETPGVSVIGYPIGCCERFQQRNAKKSIAMSLDEIRNIKEATDAFNAQRSSNPVAPNEDVNGRELLIYISMAFGNPYGESHSIDLVEKLVGELVASGARDISLADTTGVAQPPLIFDTFTQLRKKFPDVTFAGHFHSNAVEARGKIVAALDAGCTMIDSALCGMGGCPFAKDDGLVGNVATEVVVKALEERGVLPAALNKEQLKKCVLIKQEIFGVSVRDMLISQTLHDEKRFATLCQEHFKLYDVNDDGTLDYEGFRDSMIHVFAELGAPQPSEEKIRSSFAKVDIQNLGFITIDAYTMGARRLLVKRLASNTNTTTKNEERGEGVVEASSC